MVRPVITAKGVARREEILRSAMAGLAADGYRNTSLRGIARALGVEPAHILYYFDSREDLLQAVIERWDETALAEHAGEVGPAEGLDFYLATIRHNLLIPGIVHLYLTVAAEAVHPEHSAHDFFAQRFQRVRDLLESAVRHEQSRGRIGAHHDPDRAARRLIALADGLQLQALIDPSINVSADLEAAVAHLRDGR